MYQLGELKGFERSDLISLPIFKSNLYFLSFKFYAIKPNILPRANKITFTHPIY